MRIYAICSNWEFDFKWRTSDTIHLANWILDKKDFSLMPILADALQDADCNNDELLENMRNPDFKWCHGSRIIDEILGKR